MSMIVDVMKRAGAQTCVMSVVCGVVAGVCYAGSNFVTGDALTYDGVMAAVGSGTVTMLVGGSAGQLIVESLRPTGQTRALRNTKQPEA